MFDAARAIAKHSKSTPRLRSAVLDLVRKQMPAPGSFGNSLEQSNFSSLLQVVESFSGIYDPGLANSLQRLAEDFRTPEALRRHALKAYGRLSEPAGEIASEYSRLLSRSDIRLNEAVYASLVNFLAECKRGIIYVRKVLPHLDALKAGVDAAWKRELVRNSQSVDGAAIRDLRQAAADIEALAGQYDEFADRTIVNA
jgi:hypothetical protein